MEFERIERNKTIYKENGKIITVNREFSKDAESKFSSILDTLMEIVEKEEKNEG